MFKIARGRDKGNIANAFKAAKIPKQTQKGSAGYDNARENIDPHVRTKAVSTKEITLSDGSAAGFVKNTAVGVLSGGHAVTVVAGNDKELQYNNSGALAGAAHVTYDNTTGYLEITNNRYIKWGGDSYFGEDSSNNFRFAAKTGEVRIYDPSTNNNLKIYSSDSSSFLSIQAFAAHSHVFSGGAFFQNPTFIFRSLNVMGGVAAVEIEGTLDLTGNLTTTGLIDGIDVATDVAANTTHRGDNSQAHTDYLINNGDDTTSGSLGVGGAVASGTLEISASADDTDVSDINTLFIDATSNAVVMGAFVGGVIGQVLHIVKCCATANNVTLEHNEGTGNQNLFLHALADETLNAEYGGWVLVCNGTSWFDASHAKHV